MDFFAAFSHDLFKVVTGEPLGPDEDEKDFCISSGQTLGEWLEDDMKDEVVPMIKEKLGVPITDDVEEKFYEAIDEILKKTVFIDANGKEVTTDAKLEDVVFPLQVKLQDAQVAAD